MNHEDPPALPAAELAQPLALVQYLIQPSTRAKVEFGFGQLQGLKLELNQCCTRVRELERQHRRF